MEEFEEVEHWICDSCGGEIVQRRDGWIEWISYRVGDGWRGRDLRLVHHRPASPRPGGCQFDQEAEFARDGGHVNDLGLNDFSGPDGLVRLLVKVSEGQLPLIDLIDIIQRVHVAGYEAARPYFADAMCAGVFEANLPEGFYYQWQIRATLDYAHDNKASED